MVLCAWLLLLLLPGSVACAFLARSCLLRPCAGGGASAGGAEGACIYFIAKSVLVVSQNPCAECILHGMLSTTIVKIASRPASE